jgi:hypothetical protein
VACLGQLGNKYKNLVRIFEGKRPLEEIARKRKIILKWQLKSRTQGGKLDNEPFGFHNSS